MSNFTLEDYVRILNQYQELKEDYSKLLETSKAYKKLLKTTMQKEHQAIKTLDEIREQLKKIKPDLDFEPWSIYKVSGGNLFDLLQILDEVKE